MAVDILSYPLNETDYVAEDAQLYNCTRTSGVYSSDEDYIVSAVTDQPMQISVSAGIAWIRYDKFGGIVTANKAPVVFNLDSSHATLSRIDRVVIRFNQIANQVELAVKKGTPSASPAAEELQRNAEAYELAIADVMVRPGQAALRQENISDRRPDENLCGIMADGVTRIPTQALYDSWWSWFSEVQADTEEKIQALNEWVDSFRNQQGNSFDEWFEKFTSEKDSFFQNWLDALGEQLAAEVGSALFGFSIEGGHLFLYYNNEVDARRFYIENGHLMYELDDDIAGSESTSLLKLKNQMADIASRVETIEENDILNVEVQNIEYDNEPETGGEE